MALDPSNSDEKRRYENVPFNKVWFLGKTPDTPLCRSIAEPPDGRFGFVQAVQEALASQEGSSMVINATSRKTRACIPILRPRALESRGFTRDVSGEVIPAF